MSQNYVHLIAFALVAVLCVCTVTSVSGSAAGQAKDNVTCHGNCSESKSEIVNSISQLNESTTPSADPPSPHSNSTHRHDHSNFTDTEGPEENKQNVTTRISTGSTTTRSATTGSTTTGSTTTGSTTTGSTTTGSAATDSESGGNSRSTGIFFLILILIIIIILAVILYILWKKGKRYSFDLMNGEHDTPLTGVPIGTFEQTKGSTTNLDDIQEDNPDKTNPVANGCSGETPDQTSCSDQQNVPEEDSFTSDLNLNLNSPGKKVEFNLDLELIGVEPELEKQATDEPTDNDNENNNNDTNTGNDSADLFTEINLDDTQ
ncbi:putative uncharacterized protein DDB_G0292292 [Pangasianodon hypophthalmus]|uniref:putative uncharacterized protein DDB_G0292292 n=1 Tax=Pangasianodon hypophthalmus TaxID=310915 RepID=UPI0023070872|nr:putative uncharacterized protein DDB_G0292292 [Pangasianodon hypophthalmus]